MSDTNIAAPLVDPPTPPPLVDPSGTPLSTINQDPKPEAGDETKTGETKDAPKEKEPEKAAPQIDLAAIKLPEGFKADDAQMKGFTDLLSNLEIKPQERAQALLDIHTKALQDASEAASKQWDDVTTKWTNETAADKEIGTGDPKNPLKAEVKAAISKTLDKFGGTELRQALDLTGAGNNPAIIRAFSKISKLLTEGGHISGNGPTVNKPKGTGAAALYPDLPER